MRDCVGSKGRQCSFRCRKRALPLQEIQIFCYARSLVVSRVIVANSHDNTKKKCLTAGLNEGRSRG